MKLSTIIYSIKQGIKNIYRNRLFSAASVGTIAASLFLFGIFYFVAANVNYAIEKAETNVGVTVFFDAGITDPEIEEIGEKIKTRTEVDNIEYLSAEETWEQYKEKYLSEELAETFGEDNPLANSASYSVYLNDVSKQTELVNFIKSLDGVRKVNSSEAIAIGLTGINSLITYITTAIILVLLGVAIFLISTTVTMGIEVRKEEITIMKLIGAADFIVRAPFVVEGLIIGCIGSIVPLGGLFFIYGKVTEFVAERFSSSFGTMQFLEIQEIFKTLLPISLIIGIGIGFAGSFLTIRKKLRV